MVNKIFDHMLDFFATFCELGFAKRIKIVLSNLITYSIAFALVQFDHTRDSP